VLGLKKVMKRYQDKRWVDVKLLSPRGRARGCERGNHWEEGTCIDCLLVGDKTTGRSHRDGGESTKGKVPDLYMQ